MVSPCGISRCILNPAFSRTRHEARFPFVTVANILETPGSYAFDFSEAKRIGEVTRIKIAKNE